MSSRLSLLALGIGVYLAVAIGSFPASLAYRWFGPEGLTLASVEGTIWSGQAEHGAAAGLTFSNLRWQLHPAALLTGTLSVSAEAELPDGLASARITASSERLVLNDVRVNASLASIRDRFALGDVSGQLDLSLQRFETVAGILVAFGALLLRLNGLAFGEPRGDVARSEMSFAPLYAHLALVAIAGVWLPAPLVAWFDHVAGLLG